ncbi:MAG: type IV secretion system DNA-binding domain-containing protein [Eubacterium sp.]|nr:type IV secretion system DNA-binding domain-containing protein [Eubacterium sp.]
MNYDSLNLRVRKDQLGVDRTILVGHKMSDCLPVQYTSPPLLQMSGDKGNFNISADQLSKGCMLIGSTGSGKTNAFFMMLDQLLPKIKSSDVVLIFDSKGDFMNRYYEPDNPDHIVISANENHRSITKGWNIYGELFDKNGEFGESADIMAKEISKALFKNIESSNQPFFHIAPTDLFSVIMSCFVKEATEQKSYHKLNNETLVNFINSSTVQDFYNMIQKYPQFKYVQSYLGEAKLQTPQSLGVLGHLYSMISSQFIGPFKHKMPSGHFSMRRLIRERGAKVIFLEYDINLGDTLSPIYSLFFDLAIKEALTSDTGNTYLICDEMNLLPYCQRFQDAVNYGRSKGVKTVVGLQSINQLYNNYGEDEGKAIAAGFVNAICFNAVDYDTRKFVSERFGTTFESINWSGSNITRNGYTVEDSDIHNLKTGEAFIDLAGLTPFKFRFDKLV